MRAHHWAHRAEAEYGANRATWLGTITLSPIEHASIDARVAARAHETGASWLTEWTDKDWFRARCKQFGDEITKWKKAVSDQYHHLNGVRPRYSYLLVAEKHESARTSEYMVGRPHYHMLIHEPYVGALIPQADWYQTASGVVRVDDNSFLRKQWKLGYTQFELCRSADSAKYLCKYLSKAMLWRVRASLRYGNIVYDVEKTEVDKGPKAMTEKEEQGGLGYPTTIGNEI